MQTISKNNWEKFPFTINFEYFKGHNINKILRFNEKFTEILKSDQSMTKRTEITHRIEQISHEKMNWIAKNARKLTCKAA